MWSLDNAISYYRNQGAPADQGALKELLREVQRENGGRIPQFLLEPICQSYGLKKSFLLAIIRRIPSLRLADSHCLELCAGPNCGKHTALAAFAEKICRECGKKVELKFVPCMRMCAKGPNIRWDGTLYHKADEALLRQLIVES